MLEGIQVLLGNRRLEEIVCSAGVESAAHIVGLAHNAEDDNPSTLLSATDDSRCRNAVHYGHVHIHAHDIRRNTVERADRLDSVSCLPNHMKAIILMQEGFEIIACLGEIVHKENANTSVGVLQGLAVVRRHRQSPWSTRPPPNGLELREAALWASCPAAQATAHSFSRILAGQALPAFRSPAGFAPATCRPGHLPYANGYSRHRIRTPAGSAAASCQAASCSLSGPC